MKKRILFGVSLIVVILCTGCASTKQEVKSYTTSVIVIKGTSYDIPGILVRPDVDGDVPFIVMMHGTGSQKDEAGDGFKMLAPELAKKGIASIRFDFPGSGDSTASYQIYCNSLAIEAAIDVATQLGNLEGIDSNRIGILGWSQGGTDALLAAGSTDIFKSVATWAGSLSIGDMVTKKMRAEAKENGFALMEFPWRSPLELSQKWIEEADSMDVLDYVAKIDAPIASFHGTEDEDVPYTESIAVQDAAKNESSILIPIDGTGHTYGVFSGNLDKYNELRDKTVNWFVKTL